MLILGGGSLGQKPLVSGPGIAEWDWDCERPQKESAGSSGAYATVFRGELAAVY
jgi:hypothetical protein